MEIKKFHYYIKNIISSNKNITKFPSTIANQKWKQTNKNPCRHHRKTTTQLGENGE